jgi:hypothetical protein
VVREVAIAVAVCSGWIDVGRENFLLRLGIQENVVFGSLPSRVLV